MGDHIKEIIAEHEAAKQHEKRRFAEVTGYHDENEVNRCILKPQISIEVVIVFPTNGSQ